MAQILSSLSCIFVGARGLSDSVEKEIILQSVMSRLNHKVNSISQIKGKSTHKPKGLLEDEGREKRHGFCPICLLQTQ